MGSRIGWICWADVRLEGSGWNRKTFHFIFLNFKAPRNRMGKAEKFFSLASSRKGKIKVFGDNRICERKTKRPGGRGHRATRAAHAIALTYGSAELRGGMKMKRILVFSWRIQPLLFFLPGSSTVYSRLSLFIFYSCSSHLPTPQRLWHFYLFWEFDFW